MIWIWYGYDIQVNLNFIIIIMTLDYKKTSYSSVNWLKIKFRSTLNILINLQKNTNVVHITIIIHVNTNPKLPNKEIYLSLRPSVIRTTTSQTQPRLKLR